MQSVVDVVGSLLGRPITPEVKTERKRKTKCDFHFHFDFDFDNKALAELILWGFENKLNVIIFLFFCQEKYNFVIFLGFASQPAKLYRRSNRGWFKVNQFDQSAFLFNLNLI